MEDGEYPKEPSPQSLDNLHIYFDELQEELKEIEESQRVLNQNFYELTEMKFVLQHATHLFDTVRIIILIFLFLFFLFVSNWIYIF